jgi:hypothetical protein
MAAEELTPKRVAFLVADELIAPVCEKLVEEIAEGIHDGQREAVRG